MVLHIPHSSLEIPKDELLKTTQQDFDFLTDHYTDSLFIHRYSERVIFPYSRLFCDVERYRDDEKEEMSKIGHGVVYTKGATKNIIRENLSEEHIENVKSKYYDKHHKELALAVNRQTALFPKVVLVDCHSFRDDENIYADFCIGINKENVPPFIEEIIELLHSKGFTISINEPFIGSMIPEKFIGQEDIFTFMIEVNKNLYLTEKYEKNKNFINIRNTITEILDIVSNFEG